MAANLNLKPGSSTVVDAAKAYNVTVNRVLRVLAGSLTDVYTPEGDSGVVESHGRRWVNVNGASGTERHDAATLTLASDSVSVLARYLG